METQNTSKNDDRCPFAALDAMRKHGHDTTIEENHRRATRRREIRISDRFPLPLKGSPPKVVPFSNHRGEAHVAVLVS